MQFPSTKPCDDPFSFTTNRYKPSSRLACHAKRAPPGVVVKLPLLMRLTRCCCCCDLAVAIALGRTGDGNVELFREAAAAAGGQNPTSETALPPSVPVLSSEALSVSLLSTLTLNATPSRRSAALSSTCWSGAESVGGVAQTAGIGA